MQDDDLRKLSGIWKEDRWLYFELIENKPKTKFLYISAKFADKN